MVGLLLRNQMFQHCLGKNPLLLANLPGDLWVPALIQRAYYSMERLHEPKRSCPSHGCGQARSSPSKAGFLLVSLCCFSSGQPKHQSALRWPFKVFSSRPHLQLPFRWGHNKARESLCLSVLFFNVDGTSPIPCPAWAILPKPMLMETRFRVENLFTNLGMAHTCSSIWEGGWSMFWVWSLFGLYSESQANWSYRIKSISIKQTNLKKTQRNSLQIFLRLSLSFLFPWIWVFTLNLGIHKDLEIRPQERMRV